MPRDSLWNRMERPAPTPAGSSAGPPAITVRDAVPADRDALQRLAQLDSSTMPTGRVLVADRVLRRLSGSPQDRGRAQRRNH